MGRKKNTPEAEGEIDKVIDEIKEDITPEAEGEIDKYIGLKDFKFNSKAKHFKKDQVKAISHEMAILFTKKGIGRLL